MADKKKKKEVKFNMEKCMPTPPKQVGREFVRQYYIIMNASPMNLHCFYTDDASFLHDDMDPTERRTIKAEGKMEIRDVMLDRVPKYKHTSTKIFTVDTIETLNDGLIVQVIGEISYNEQPMRPFSQTVILVPKTPFHYFVQNDIFRFCDFDFDTIKSANDLVASQSKPDDAKPPEQDWGTQCEEPIESYEKKVASMQSQPRVDPAQHRAERARPENEVKLDTSDSGLSSDAEKAIMDIQSLNLKSMLQESRAITKDTVAKRVPPPIAVDREPTTSEAKSDVKELSENRSQLFRDSCILTIGNVVNPNIEFGDTKGDEPAASEVEKMQDSGETAHEPMGEAVKVDEVSIGKSRYRKRKEKEKRKAMSEIFKEQSLDESNEEPEARQSPTESIVQADQPSVEGESSPPDGKTETPIEQPTEAEPPESTAQETPKPATKTYADLAKSGNDEWVDELAGRRDVKFTAEAARPRPTLSRQSSRSDKTTPPSSADSTRSSPKNDLLQVFIGNIPHSASEDDIRRMFSPYGRLTRLRLHSNERKQWRPRYAFITYESIQSVRQCLMRKNTFYLPEITPDGQKMNRLNVNGDPSVDIWDEVGNRKPVDDRFDLKTFGRNFVLDSKDGKGKQSPESDSSNGDSMHGERYKRSVRN